MDNFPVNTIIHGHFYQPPREDPWIDIIEDQPSSLPYKNWNERIAKECYGPNCYSRILDNKGKIFDIINNYQYISFNFGPTLLSWLEKEEKEIYNLIIQADRFSIEMHNGHGNAIAQVYNHVIMPLQNLEDQKTQIIWGLKDFNKRFNRKSEGIWLAETAVNYETIDLLIEFGIKYIILSPEQAKGFKKIDEEKWTDVHHGGINSKRVYKIVRNHGEIAVFYYDKEISTAISFQHLLYDANNFAQRIINNRKENDLIVIASDGEVYGHHEPFGDMCLAKLIKEYYLDKNIINLLNFGEYLELFPPKYETILYLGDDGQGSSWSCIHGVGRWYKDCGCNTGGKAGWNQKWRTPLREAFDEVKKSVDEYFIQEVSRYIRNPWDLRNSYIDFILNKHNFNNMEFMNKQFNIKINKKETSYILSLLEMQKNSMFMYTSCGWFFSELSGIETIQNIKYAYRAIMLMGLAKDNVLKKFEQKLESAISNMKEYKNGRWILENMIYNKIHDFYHIVNNFVTLLKYIPKDLLINFSIVSIYGYEDFTINRIGNSRFYEGNINIYDKRDCITRDYIFIFEELNHFHKIYIFTGVEKNLFKTVRKDLLIDTFNLTSYNNSGFILLTRDDLISEIKNFITEYEYKDKKTELINNNINFFNIFKDHLIYIKEKGIPIQELYKSFLKFTAECIFSKLFLELEDFPDRKLYVELIDLFKLLKFYMIKPDITIIKKKLSFILYGKLFLAKDNLSSDSYKKALILLEFCTKIGIILEKSNSENIIFSLLKNKIPRIIDEINLISDKDKKGELIIQCRNLIILAENFNINAEDEKKYFFQKIQITNDFFSYYNLK